MKRLMNYVLLLLIIISFGSKITFAQNSNGDAVKAALNNLFNYSKSKLYEKAAALIAYDGEDKNRLQKDSFNYANKDELNQVKRICKKISALLELSNKHEFGDFKTSSINGKDNYTIDVNFVSGEQKLITSFKFVKTEKGMLLVSMN